MLKFIKIFNYYKKNIMLCNKYIKFNLFRFIISETPSYLWDDWPKLWTWKNAELLTKFSDYLESTDIDWDNYFSINEIKWLSQDLYKLADDLWVVKFPKWLPKYTLLTRITK